VYAADPNYAAGGATNDTVFLDNDGKLYLGGGTGRAENSNAGGVLRGSWNVTGTLSGGGLADLAFEDWPASDGSEYVAKNGAWVVATGVSASTATNIAETVAFDSWWEATALTSAATVTVTRTHGLETSLYLTNSATLVFDTSTFPTNGAATVGMGAYIGTNSITRGAGIESNSWSALTLLTNAWNDLVFRKGVGASEFEVRQ
jgi:hypothetical protein